MIHLVRASFVTFLFALVWGAWLLFCWATELGLQPKDLTREALIALILVQVFQASWYTSKLED